jgi:hypothetical protein
MIRTPPGFAARRPHDRAAVLGLLGLYWLMMAMGFGPESLARLQRPEGLGYPWIVHAHAVAFVGWLVLLSVQVALVQGGRIGLHRWLGRWGGALALAMLVLGPATSLTMNGQTLGQPGVDHGFVIVTWVEIALFGGLVALALWFRTDAAAHRRLMLIASFAMTSGGFGRWWGACILAAWGDGAWASFLASHLGTLILLGLMAGHDLATRRGLHPALVTGAGLVLAGLVAAEAVYQSRWWPPLAVQLIRAATA